MKARNRISVALTLASFACLWPGLTFDLITLSASMNVLGSEMELFRETRSILGTVDALRESGNDLVAGMIFFFGVVVPVVKGAILFLVLSPLVRDPRLRGRLFAFVCAIGKWAMSDVFTVGVLVAFLSAKATDGLDASIEHGFWWFVGYCMLSILAMQFLKLPAASGDGPQPDGDGDRRG